ncbi:MAG TPA: enoyl-CoA-hydratase DpgB [Blastocatellia bacterium]|nr:enoyl-CoA-hydratase DpgB [Blastocatellia bacterium]
MSTVLIKNRPVVQIEVNGDEPVCSELTAQLGSAIDQAEDLGPGAIMLIHLAGQADPAAVRPWPGQIDFQSVRKWENVLRRIERSNSATILFVEHACSAVALDLLVVTDRRLAGGDFFAPSPIFRGAVWPSMTLYRLARQIGESSARKIALDADEISAQRGIELRIIDEIIDVGTDGAERTARLLRNAPPEDFAIARRLMQDSLSTSFEEALGAHLAACDRALRRSTGGEFEKARDVASAV